MASSGSYDFTVTRSNIIESALRKCGVLIEGASASSAQLTNGAEALNIILKALASTGLPLWNIFRGYIYPMEDVNKATFGTDHISTELIHTQVSTAAAASDTTIEVDSITSMAASDNIGIECSDGTIHWDTISGSPSGTTVTLTTGLDAAVAVDANVYVYTTKMTSPLRITHAWRRLYSAGDGQLGGKTTPINIVSREEFFAISDLTTEDYPYTMYHQPKVTSGSLLGEVHFYNRYKDGKALIEFDCWQRFEDMDSATDNLGMPQEWFSAIVWELAAVLAVEYGCPGAKVAYCEQKAGVERVKVEQMGMEEGSVYFVPRME